MKRITLLLTFFLFYINSLSAQEWFTNFDETKAMAQKENKNI